MKKVSMWEIFYGFLIIGTITIGGGPGSLPIIQNYIVDKKKWISQEQMLEYTTISQSMPGVISTNIGIFIGNKLSGKKGAFAAAIGGILPAFLSILGFAMFLRPFLENPLMQKAFSGIRIAIIGLIINAGYRMSQVMNWNKTYIAIAVISFIVFVFTNTNPVLLFIFGGLVGLFTYQRRKTIRGDN